MQEHDLPLSAHYQADEPGLNSGEPLPAGAGAAMSTDALEDAYHGMLLPLAQEVEAGAPFCQRCEVLPENLRGPGTVHLRPPHTHTLGKVLEIARELHVQVIAEGTEQERELSWFAEHGVKLAQGNYFARPATPPPSPKPRVQAK